MEMAVRIIPIALLVPNQTVLWVKQNRSLNSASIVGVIISRDTARSGE
jgi:hypothetical protein